MRCLHYHMSDMAKAWGDIISTVRTVLGREVLVAAGGAELGDVGVGGGLGGQRGEAVPRQHGHEHCARLQAHTQLLQPVRHSRLRVIHGIVQVLHARLHRDCTRHRHPVIIGVPER